MCKQFKLFLLLNLSFTLTQSELRRTNTTITNTLAASVKTDSIYNSICATDTTFTTLHEYVITDNRINTAHELSGGQTEYHCFDTNTTGQNIYVRGTYGGHGYFEGALSLLSKKLRTFQINWWQTTLTTFNHTSTYEATTGSALITYSADWSTVSGVYWPFGSSPMNTNAFNSWSSGVSGVASQPLCSSSPNTATMKAQVMRKCLYPGKQWAGARSALSYYSSDAAHVFRDLAATSERGETSFSVLPAGGAGASVGAYTYKYTVATDGIAGTEDGVFGPGMVSFPVGTGLGRVGWWVALSGPYKGDQGSFVYMTVQDNGKSSELVDGTPASYVIGFYCTAAVCQEESYVGVGLQPHLQISPWFYQPKGLLNDMYIFTKYAWEKDLTCPYIFTLADGMAVMFGLLSFASFLLMVKWCRTPGKSYVIAVPV